MTGERTSEDGPGEVPPEPPRRMGRGVSEKRIKLTVVIVVVVVIVAVLLWGMVPDRIYEVHEVQDEIDGLEGRYINVKGVVTSWETGRSNFTLADTNDADITIEVNHKGAFPEGFGYNASVVVKGDVRMVSTTVTLDSDEIQIGCPSKY